MEYSLEISKEAEKDLLKIKCFFELSKKKNNFNKELLKELNHLKKTPLAFQTYYREIRIIHLKTLKYSIHYLVKKNKVFILRILHQNQLYP